MLRIWRNFAAVVWLMLLLTLMCSHATGLSPEEGAALLSIKNDWQAKYNTSTWVSGSDPCASNWSGVQCDQLGNHVISLNLTHMGLVGKLPAAMGNLTFLEVLDVSNWDPAKVHGTGSNAVTGDFAQLANLTSLRVLNISWNAIGQGIPDIFYPLTNITDLMMDNCFMTGPLSPKIANLQNLQRLHPGNNTMSGGLPKELGSLANLVELTLWDSGFNSEIPAEIGNLAYLEYLNLHDCGLWGGLPSTFGGLKQMQTLLLYNNKLTGSIPDTWQNMARLSQLRLSRNYLSGTIPTWISNFTHLTLLQLQDNEFIGPYPAKLSDLMVAGDLTNLQLGCNYLNETDPTGPPGNHSKWDVTPNCFVIKKRTTRDTCRQSTLCDQFFSSLTNGWCPPCPQDQTFNNATLCTCKLQGKKGNIIPIVGGVVGAALGVLIIVGVILCIFWKRKKDRAKFADGRFDPALARELNDSNWQVPPGVQRFRLLELSAATGGFDKAHEIGMGGFGKVFVGNFKNGKSFAIKRASGLVTSTQGLAEFRNEVLLLSRLHHRNLVRLEGFCDESGLQARPRLRSGGIQGIVDPALGDGYPKEIFEDMAELALECSMFNKDDRPSMKAVLNVLEPHLNGCQPPELSDAYSSTWESMDSSIPTEASSSTNVTTHSTHSRDSEVTAIEMTSTLLPR